jgi:hypothetical protein
MPADPRLGSAILPTGGPWLVHGTAIWARYRILFEGGYMSRVLVRLILCAPILALFLATSPSIAADGDDDLYRAARLYWDGDSMAAIEIWRRLAEDGSARGAAP